MLYFWGEVTARWLSCGMRKYIATWLRWCRRGAVTCLHVSDQGRSRHTHHLKLYSCIRVTAVAHATPTNFSTPSKFIL